MYCLQLVFEEVIEQVKEKEEKEAKRRERLADDFTALLYSLKVYIIHFGKNPSNAVSFSSTTFTPGVKFHRVLYIKNPEYE